MRNIPESSLSFFLSELRKLGLVDKSVTSDHPSYQQANQKFREEIEEAFWEGGQEVPVHGNACTQYFNRTFGGGNDENI